MCATDGKRVLQTAIFYSYESRKVLDQPEIRYSPFTAADEKIPLSMVHVNNKPQHLVF